MTVASVEMPRGQKRTVRLAATYTANGATALQCTAGGGTVSSNGAAMTARRVATLHGS